MNLKLIVELNDGDTLIAKEIEKINSFQSTTPHNNNNHICSRNIKQKHHKSKKRNRSRSKSSSRSRSSSYNESDNEPKQVI